MENDGRVIGVAAVLPAVGGTSRGLQRLARRLGEKTIVLLMAWWTGISSLQPAPGPEEKRPNLLFILTDQQRADTLGAYGNRKIRTPHLDQLAEKGFVFESFYVANVVCAPSRATLLTGLYSHTHGVWTNNVPPLDQKVPILIDMLREGDYVAGYYGKWHLGNEIFKQRGFTHFDSTEIYQRWWTEDQDHSQRSGYSHFLVERGVKPDGPYGHSRDLANRLPKELSKPAYLAAKGIEFLERYRDRPFVLYLSFLEPHAWADHAKLPLRNVNDKLYDPADMEVPETFFEAMDPSVSYPKREARVSLIRGQFPIAYPQTLEEFKARYWGLVTQVDEMVGRVLQRLRELGLEEDTLVVFTSDHGEMMGDHRLMSKEFTYEESIRVPLILRAPALEGKRRRIAQPIGQVDLVPTLLELMGQPLPSHLQGRSLAPHLSRGEQIPDRDVFVTTSLPGYTQSWNSGHVAHLRTIITPERWKLTVNGVGGGELYDLRRDPKERKNLFHGEEHRQIVEDLTSRIHNWMKETGDDTFVDLNQPWPSERDYEQIELDLHVPSEGALNRRIELSAVVSGGKPPFQCGWSGAVSSDCEITTFDEVGEYATRFTNTFSAEGEYRIRFTVTDARGKSLSKFKIIKIVVP